MSLRRGAILLALVALVVLLSVSFPALSRAEAPELPILPKHITLTWTDDPKTSQTITWQTSVQTSGVVEFAMEKGKSRIPVRMKTAAADTRAIATNQGTVYIHSASLAGLKPGTRYDYRVGNGAGWSEYRSFRTMSAKSQDFMFLVFGDSQSINYATWRSTLLQAYRTHSQAAFLVSVGDLVDTGEDYREWNAWFSAAKDVIDTIPVVPAVGNHETYTLNRKFSPPRLFTDQFSLPQNGPSGLTEQVYSFDYGDVHFVVLDTQEGEQRQFLPDLLARQKAWLEQDLMQTTKRWKVVIMHRPPYDNKTFRDNASVRKVLAPVLEAHQVDVVFTGHDHVYARTVPLFGGEAGKAGTIYVAAGRSGSKTYRSASANPRNAFFYNPLDEPNYLAVQVKSDTLTIRAFKQSGALIDEWAVKKNHE